VIALSVQRETGGNLAETLSNLADILRRRKQMKAKAHAMASETRATTMNPWRIAGRSHWRADADLARLFDAAFSTTSAGWSSTRSPSRCS